MGLTRIKTDGSKVPMDLELHSWITIEKQFGLYYHNMYRVVMPPNVANNIVLNSPSGYNSGTSNPMSWIRFFNKPELFGLDTMWCQLGVYEHITLVTAYPIGALPYTDQVRRHVIDLFYAQFNMQAEWDHVKKYITHDDLHQLFNRPSTLWIDGDDRKVWFPNPSPLNRSGYEGRFGKDTLEPHDATLINAVKSGVKGALFPVEDLLGLGDIEHQNGINSAMYKAGKSVTVLGGMAMAGMLTRFI